MILFDLIFISSVIFGLIGTLLFAITVLMSSIDSLKYLASSPFGGWNELLFFDLVKQRGRYCVGIVFMVCSFTAQSFLFFLPKIKPDFLNNVRASTSLSAVILLLICLVPFLSVYCVNSVQMKKAKKIAMEFVKQK